MLSGDPIRGSVNGAARPGVALKTRQLGRRPRRARRQVQGKPLHYT